MPEVFEAFKSTNLPEVEVEVTLRAVPEVKAEALKTNAEEVVVPVVTEEV